MRACVQRRMQRHCYSVLSWTLADETEKSCLAQDLALTAKPWRCGGCRRLRTPEEKDAGGAGWPPPRGQRPPAPLPGSQRLRVARRHEKVSVELGWRTIRAGRGKRPPGGPSWRPRNTPAPTVDPTPPPTTTALSNAALTSGENLVVGFCFSVLRCGVVVAAVQGTSAPLTPPLATHPPPHPPGPGPPPRTPLISL